MTYIYKGREKEYQKEYRKKNIRRLRKYKKLWSQSPEGKKVIKRWGKSHKAKEYGKRYREKNKEHVRKLYKRWSQTIEGRLNKSVRQRNRYYKLKDLSLQVVQFVYENNIKTYGTLTCYLCLNPIAFGKDCLEHKVPLSRGGRNRIENLDIACRHCNAKKHNKTVEEFHASGHSS